MLLASGVVSLIYKRVCLWLCRKISN